MDVATSRAIGGEDPALDVAAIEKVEAELNHFIERRAEAAKKENVEEMLWQDSVRRHHEGVRRRNRAAWFAHFCTMAENYTRLAQDYQRRAEELCQEGAV